MQTEISVVDLQNSEEFKQYMMPQIIDYLAKKEELLSKLQAGFDNFNSLLKQAKDLSIRGLSVVESFQKKKQEYSLDKSNLYIPKKVGSIFYIFIQNNLRKAIDLEAEIKQTLKKELSQKQEKQLNLNFIKGKSQIFQVSLSGSSIGKINKKSLKSNQIFRLSLFFGYSVQEFRKIEYISDLIPSYLKEYHSKLVEQSIEQGNIANLFSAKNVFAKTKENYLFPVKIKLQSCPTIFNSFEMMVSILKLQSQQQFLIFNESGQILGITEKLFRNLFKNPFEKKVKFAHNKNKNDSLNNLKQKPKTAEYSSNQNLDVFNVYNSFNIFLIFQNLLDIVQPTVEQKGSQKLDNLDAQEDQINGINNSNQFKESYKIQKYVCVKKFFTIRFPSQLQELSKKFTSQVSQNIKTSNLSFDSKQFYRNSVQFMKDNSSSFDEKKSLQNFEAVVTIVSNKVGYHHNLQQINKQYFTMQVHEYRIKKNNIQKTNNQNSNQQPQYFSSFYSNCQLVTSMQAAQLNSYDALSSQIYSPKSQQINSKESQNFDNSQAQSTQQSNNQTPTSKSSSSASSSSSSSSSPKSVSQIQTNINVQTEYSTIIEQNKNVSGDQQNIQPSDNNQNFTNIVNHYQINENEKINNLVQVLNQDKNTKISSPYQEENKNPSKSLSSIGTNGRRLSKFGEQAAYFKSIDAIQKHNYSLSTINQDLERDIQNFNQLVPLNSSKNNLIVTERNSIRITNSSSSNLFSSLLTSTPGNNQQSKLQFLDVNDNRNNKEQDSDTESQKKKKVKAKIRSSFRRAILANKQKIQNLEYDFFDLNKKQSEQEDHDDDDDHQKQKYESMFNEDNEAKQIEGEEDEEENRSKIQNKNKSIIKQNKSKINGRDNQKDEEDQISNEQNFVKYDYELIQKYINCSSHNIYGSSTLTLNITILIFISLCAIYLLKVLTFTSNVQSIVDKKSVVLEFNTIYSKQLSEQLFSHFLQEIQFYDNYDSYTNYLPKLTERCKQNSQEYKDIYFQFLNYFSQLESSILTQKTIIPTFSSRQQNLSFQTQADLMQMVSYYILKQGSTEGDFQSKEQSNGYYFMLKNYNQTLGLSQNLYESITIHLSNSISEIKIFFYIISIISVSIFSALNLVSLKKLNDFISFKRRILLVISRISLDELDIEILKIDNSISQLTDQMDSWISFDFIKLITNTKKSSQPKNLLSKFNNQKQTKRKEIQASSLIFDQQINKKIQFITYLLISISCIAFQGGYVLKNYLEIIKIESSFNSIQQTDKSLNNFVQTLTYSAILFSQQYFTEHQTSYPDFDLSDIYDLYKTNLGKLKEFSNWISQYQFNEDININNYQEQIQYIMKSSLCDTNSPIYQNCTSISQNISEFYTQGLQGILTQYFVYLQTYDSFLQNKPLVNKKQNDLLIGFYDQQYFEILYLNGFIMPLISFNELKNLFDSYIISETNKIQQNCLLYFLIGGLSLVIVFYIISLKIYNYTKTDVQAMIFSLTLIPHYKFQDEATIYILKEFLKDTDTITGWSVINRVKCSGQVIDANKNVYMMSSSQTSSTKTYTNLPSHYKYEIRIDFIVLDYPSGYVKFQADSTILGQYYYWAQGDALKICGNPTVNDAYGRVQYQNSHTSSSLTITISHSLGYSSQLGILDLQIFLDTCHPFCKACNGPDSTNCTSCNSGTLTSGECKCTAPLLMQNGVCVSTCAAPQMASGNICVDDPCQINCSSCSTTTPRKCIKCSGSNRLFNGSCIDQCPSYSDNINGECIDMITKYWNGYYLYKGFFDSDFSSISTDGSGFVTNFYDPNGVIPNSDYAKYSDCYGIRLFAGFGLYGKSVVISQEWPIPWKHSSVLVKMRYVQVENYEINSGIPEKLSIMLNGQEQAYIVGGGTDMGCGRLDQGETIGWLIANTTKTVTDQKLKLEITNNFQDPAWYEGFAFREVSIIVSKCVDNCTKCTDYDGCVQCDTSYYLYRAQCYLNKCPDGSYQDKTKLPLLICADCDSTCLTCSDSGPSKCLTCSTPPYLFKQNQCLVSCGDQFYPGTTSCLQCNPICYNCSGPSTTQCTSCSTGRFYLVSTHECLLNCPSGFYNDSTKNICSPCNAQCYTCSGPSATQCLTCEPPKMFLSVNSCGLACSVNQIVLNVILQKNLLLKKPGYFANTANQICTPCKSPCQTCVTTETNCVTCITNYYLQNGNQCLTTCNSRFFPNTVTNTCDPCNTLCVNCSGPNSTQCTSCDANTGFLQNSQCVSQCAIGTYGDVNTYTCKTCDSSCYACNAPGDSTSCTKCLAPNFLNNLGQCQPTCPNSYYGDKSNLVCKLCHPTCLQCTDGNSTSCTKCAVGRYLSNGQCLLKCPDGTYPDNVNQVCNNCYYTCAQCTDSVSTACVTCQNGRFFYSGSCFLKCPDGFYNDIMSLSCKSCDKTCKTCASSGDNMCLSCGSGKYLNNNQCVPTCLDGYYMDNNSNQCEICQATCKTCYGPLADNCQTCSGNRFLDPTNFTCVSYCPSSFFADLTTQKCVQCDSSCQNCTGTQPNQCTECPNGTYLIEGECQATCKSGYFPVTQPNICSPCHASCLTCTGALESQCFSCGSGRYQLGYVCLEQCPDNYYGDATSNSCQQCNSNCFLCNGGTSSNCTKCVSGMYLYNGTCVKICPSGYFGSDLRGKCLQCDPTCATCDKVNPSTCLTCISNLYLYQSQCLQQCPDGTFESTAIAQSQDSNSSQQIINICKNCYYGCKLCNGETDESCFVWEKVEVYQQESKIIYWIFVGQSIYSTFAFFFGFYRDYKCKQLDEILEESNEDKEDLKNLNETPSPDKTNNENIYNITNNSHMPSKNSFQKQARRKRPNTIILQELMPQENISPSGTQYNTLLNKDENRHTQHDERSSINTFNIEKNSPTPRKNSQLLKSGMGTNQFISFYQSNTNISSIRKLQRKPTVGGTVKTAMIIPSEVKKKENFEFSLNKNLFFFYLIFNILIRYDKYLIRPLRALIFYAKTILLLWITSRTMPNQYYVVFSFVIALHILSGMVLNVSRFISKQLPRAAAIVFTLIVILIMFKLFWFFLPELSVINYSQDRDWSFLYLYAFCFDIGVFQIIFNGIQYFYTKNIISRPPVTWSKSKKVASKILYSDLVASWLKEK